MISFKVDAGDVGRLRSFTQEVGKFAEPESQRDSIKMIGIYGEQLLNAARRAGVKDYTGNLRNSLLTPIPVGKTDAQLVLPGYFYPLGKSGPGRWVDIEKYPYPLADWAEKVGFQPREGRYVYVRPHPFIDAGEFNARAIIREKIQSGDLEVVRRFIRR